MAQHGCQERITTKKHVVDAYLDGINGWDDRLYSYWIYMRIIVTLHRAIATIIWHGIQRIAQNLRSYGSCHHFYQHNSSEQGWIYCYTIVMAYIVQLNSALHHTDSMDTEWRRGCAPHKPKLTRTRAGKVTNITSIDAVRISNGNVLLYYHY